MWSNLNRKDRKHFSLVDEEFERIAFRNQEIERKVECLEKHNQLCIDELRKLDSKILETLQNVQIQISGNEKLKEEIDRCHKCMELVKQQVSLLNKNLAKTDNRIAESFSCNVKSNETTRQVLLQDILPNVTAMHRNTSDAMVSLNEIKSNIENHNQLVLNSVKDMQKAALDLRDNETTKKSNAKLENVLQEISLLDQSTRLILLKSVIDSIENAAKDVKS